MKKEVLKRVLAKHRFPILIIIFLILIINVLYQQKQTYKFLLLHEYQAVPDIDLVNELKQTPDGLLGEVRGFVKFDQIKDQPKELRQYYIISSLRDATAKLHRSFFLEEIVKMKYLAPKSLGISKMTVVGETESNVILEDTGGNKFFIDKSTDEVSIKDTTGNNAVLLTDDADFSKFIKEWVSK